MALQKILAFALIIFSCALGYAQEDVDPAEPEVESLEADSDTVPLIRKNREVAPSLYRQDKRLIEHPNAAKGLFLIDKQKNYFYRVPESEQKYAGALKIGLFQPENLANPDRPDLTFNVVYEDNEVPMIQYDFERPWFRGRLGKLGYKLGIGLYIAQGNGVFENTSITDTPLEGFTLLVVPVSAGLVYRLQIWDAQPLVPFVGGAFDAFLFAERRDDDLNPDLGARFGVSPMAHVSAGATIPLGRGPRAFLDLDREYGINSIALIAEYRNYIALSDTYDFSSDFFGAGILAEY